MFGQADFLQLRVGIDMLIDEMRQVPAILPADAAQLSHDCRRISSPVIVAREIDCSAVEIDAQRLHSPLVRLQDVIEEKALLDLESARETRHAAERSRMFPGHSQTANSAHRRTEEPGV